MKKKKAIVIGAGFGGLSQAALLAKDGFQVTVLEKNDQPGGRASTFSDQGFTFDMGPSWYLMPEVFEKFLKQFNKATSDYYNLKQLDPNYRIFFAPNEITDISSNLAKTLNTFKDLEKDGDIKLFNYLKTAQYQYETSMSSFIYRDFKNIFSLLDRKLLIEGSKLHIFESMDRFVKRYFESDKAMKIIQYSLVFLGGSPKNTPAIYSLMSHIDFNLGVFYPVGGFYKVVEAFYKLALDQGAKFKFETPTKKIVIKNGKIFGVLTDKGIIKTDLVIVSADYQFSENVLLEKRYQSYSKNYWDKKTIAPSAFIIYLGLNKKIKNLEHHNLFLDKDWGKHFDQIFKNPGLPDNPSYYICCPSKTDSSVAPEGGENLFILVPVASGIRDSKYIRQLYYSKIITHIETLLNQNITNSILVKKIFTVSDFKNRYNAYRGSALGLSHTLFQTAFFRPSHKSKKVKNLYYTGQYTTPGIGVPMTIISSEITQKIILKEHDQQ